MRRDANTGQGGKSLTPLLIASASFFICLAAVAVRFSSAGLDAFLLLPAFLLMVLIPAHIAHRKRLFTSDMFFAVFIAGLSISLLIRFFLLDFQHTDYSDFLHPWVQEMRSLPGFEPVTEKIGNYNIPYLYLLFIISRLPFSDLYLIKLFSIVFDIACAFAVLRLTSLFTDSSGKKLFPFLAFMFIPLSILNSSYWAQCDSVYTAFCLYAIYYGIRGRSAKCMVFAALGFAFKLQAVFILPFLLLMLLTRRIRWRFIWVYPLTFVLASVPALLCGRSFEDTFSIYLEQTDYYTHLTMNAPTFWAFFPDSLSGLLTTPAIGCAAVAILLVMLLFFPKLPDMAEKELLELAFLLSLLVPYFLPRMHERYFYISECLAVVYLVLKPSRLLIPLTLILISFSRYLLFLFGLGDSMPPLSACSAALGAAILLLTALTYRGLPKKNHSIRSVLGIKT